MLLGRCERLARRSMLTFIRQSYAKLRENDAFSICAHPAVVANYFLFRREMRTRPEVMRSRPINVEIELTNRCNLACIQCLRSRGLKPYALGDMEYEKFRRILDQFPYLVTLGLNGFGEALLHDGFFEMVAHARKKRPWAKIGIYSNGMLLDDHRVERLVGSGVTEIDVSIDAATDETYRRVRRGGRLPLVHGGIRRLVAARRAAKATLPRIGVNYVLLNDNEGELVPFVEQAADLGVDFINCITYATYDWGFDNRRSRVSYEKELAAARRRISELGVRCKSFPTVDFRWTDSKTPFDCSFFWGESVRITHAGDVTLGCCTPFKETYSYGNVLEEPFERIWNGAKYRENRRSAVRQVSPNETCASCKKFAASFFAPRAGRPAHLGLVRKRST
jgi:radical SAM protein with 4Fe4S-binding SPASM domain